ncbi:MAG: SDR family NAD(P)-dependent oxidoreductase [Microgenomates group bacterium]
MLKYGMFAGKTVLVTGGGKKIGRAIAEKFFDFGANVVVNDIVPLSHTEIKPQLSASEKFFYSRGDISDLNYQEKLTKDSLKKFSKIDFLINNVGFGSGRGLFDLDPKLMEVSIKTNLIAPFFLSQKIARQMVEKKIPGAIIFISSIHARIPSGNPDYSSTKSALEILTKEMAFELGPFGIRVNAIAPGRITDKKQTDSRIPLLHQTGTPSEIAQVALFLCDNSSEYINGEVITVDGGLSLAFPR